MGEARWTPAGGPRGALRHLLRHPCIAAAAGHSSAPGCPALPLPQVPKLLGNPPTFSKAGAARLVGLGPRKDAKQSKEEMRQVRAAAVVWEATSCRLSCCRLRCRPSAFRGLVCALLCGPTWHACFVLVQT